MKRGQVKKGDLVKMSHASDVVFQVLDIEGFMVQIREAGTEYRPQWVDVCYVQSKVERS